MAATTKKDPRRGKSGPGAHVCSGEPPVTGSGWQPGSEAENQQGADFAAEAWMRGEPQQDSRYSGLPRSL